MIKRLLFVFELAAVLVGLVILWIVYRDRRVCDSICNRGQCPCAETCPLHRGQP